MFCINCGEEIPDKSRFCPACGTNLTDVNNNTPVRNTMPDVDTAAPTVNKEENQAPESPQTVIDTEGQMPDAEEASIEQDDTMPSFTQAANIEDVVGKNVKYYLSEFERIERGEKARFNWAAFFLSVFFCFYRKCGELFKKYFLIPIAIMIVAMAITAVSTANFSLGLMAVGGVASFVGSVWGFISCIRFGRNFNQEYYSHCNTVLSSDCEKKYGTSIGSPLLAVAVIAIASIAVPLAASFIGASGNSSVFDDSNYSILDGEYVIVEDAPINEHTYMNFNGNGPGSIQIYALEDPDTVIEGSYKIVPTETILDWSDAYSLLICTEYLDDYIELFKFTLFDDSMYYVCFSEEFEYEDGNTAMMVPFTEEWGFTSGSDSSDSTPSASKKPPAMVSDLPDWCSGIYYGDDIHSKIIFSDMLNGTSNGPFHIFIYRAADIENCIGSWDGNRLSFTGDFNDKVGAVSGTLTYSGDGIIELTINESDLYPISSGVNMNFYYEFLGDLSTVDWGEDPYGITGVYASLDVPANRVIIRNTSDMIVLELMNHTDTIATATLTVGYNLENNNDIYYFNTYTIGSECELSGCIDPSSELLEIWESSSENELSAYGLQGFFVKQSI